MGTKKREKVKDFSNLIENAYQFKLDERFRLNEPFSDTDKNTIKAKEAFNPIEKLASLQIEELPAFVHEIRTNISIYLEMLAHLLLDKKNVDTLTQTDLLKDIIKHNQSTFEQKWKRPLQLYLPLTVAQATLLNLAIVPAAQKLGSMQGKIMYEIIIRQNISFELNQLFKKLHRKHWLTDWGYMELVLQTSPKSSRDELDVILKKAKIGDTNRKKFLAKHFPARGEYWIYKNSDGTYFCSRPDKKSIYEVSEKGYNSYDGAWDRMSVLNNSSINTKTLEVTKVT